MGQLELNGRRRHRQSDLRTREDDAAFIVASVLGARVERRDRPGAPDGTHDFDLLTDQGQRIALEVTTSTNSDDLQMLKAITTGEWGAPSLASSWWVKVPHPREGPRVSIRKIERRAESLLRVVEDHGLSDVDCRNVGPDQACRAAIEGLKGLGVLGGRTVSVTPPQIFVSSIGGGGWVDPEGVNRAIEAEAEPNRAKLERAVADERHLWVWVDMTSFPAETAMALGNVPASPPALPPSITAAWAATFGYRGGAQNRATELWFVRPPQGWEVLKVPAG